MIDLEEATRALRDESAGASVGAAQTRARVMRSLHEGTHRRRLRWGFGLPLAVVFAGSTAFAGARGDLGDTVQEAFSSVRALIAGAPAKPPSAPLPAQRSTAVAPPPISPGAPPEIAAPATPPALAHPVPALAQPSSPAHPSPPAQARSGATAPSAPEPQSDPRVMAPLTAVPTAGESTPEAIPAPTESNEATRRYRKAHDAQFVQGDCTRALAAYDEYLAAAPSDRLVPEARYNRAVCLVRLGRTTEASSALRPFADGAYGDFRRREARELLDALGAR